MALPMRLLMAVVTRSASPHTSQPSSIAVTSSMRCSSAMRRLRSAASRAHAPTSMSVGSLTTSAPWRRDSSTISLTRRVSRSDSTLIRLAKRATASGSSCASSTASASSEMPPTGVFSSWLTLARKSRRISSTRAALDRSSTRRSTWSAPRGATRAATTRRPSPIPFCRVSSASRMIPSRRTARARWSSSGCTSSWPRTSPCATAAGELLTTRSEESTRMPLERRTAMTSPTPGGSGWSMGTACSAAVDRSDRRTATIARPPRARPAMPPSVAAVVGSTTLSVRIRPRGSDHARSGHADREPTVHLGVPTHSRSPASLCTSGEVTPRSYAVPRASRSGRLALVPSARDTDGATRAASTDDDARPATDRKTMRDQFHEDLDTISDQLVELTRLAGSAISRATTALLDADVHLAESVIEADRKLDDIRIELDELSIDLLARQQPVATDLRIVVTAMHMSSDLERMGDLARHVAKVARLRTPESAVPPELRSHILQMGQVAEAIVAKCGSIIASKDVAAAIALEKDDDAMDDLHRELFAALLDENTSWSRSSILDLTLVGRYYERFADHAVSVARRVVYLVTGEYDSEVSFDHEDDEDADVIAEIERGTTPITPA